MRIMHVSTRLILGGSQENTVLSCEGQSDRGHAVSLVYGPIYGPEGSMLDRVKAHGGIEPIETPNLIRQVHPLRDWKCRGELRRLIRDWKPDVVHTHSSKAGILGRDAGWLERVPAVVHTIHGPPFHRYEKAWRNRMYILAERYAAKRCHLICSVAEAMTQQFLDAGIGRPEQYRTVYSGMEVGPFLDAGVTRDQMREPLGLHEDDFVIGTVSRLAELKGHDDLLDALGPMMQQDQRIKLLWVGDGWWRERLLERVKQMGLTDQVVTTGLVPPEEIPKLHRAMDVLIHPSYREGLPRAVTQGLLSGLPVIAYDVDGTREACIDGETGRLLRAGDLAGLEDAVRWMHDHPSERAELAERGRAMCRTRFSAETMVDALDRAYREVLERS